MHDSTVIVPSDDAFEATFYVESDRSVQPPKIYRPHVHDSIELYFLIDGEATFAVENRVFDLSPGDVVLSLPNELHHCIRKSESRHEHACAWFAPSRGFLLDAFINSDRRKLSLKNETKTELLDLLAKLEKSAIDRDVHLQYALLVHVLALLRPAAARNVDRDDEVRPLPPLLCDVLDDIALNFRDVASVGQLAERHFVSRSTLSRLFDERLHTTPKAYIESKKLAHARKLLHEGASVAAAATDSGFPDTSNFIRLFRTRFNVTPAKYRADLNADFLSRDDFIPAPKDK